MRPQRCSIMCGRYARVTPSTAARLRRMSGSHSAGPVSTNDFTTKPSAGMPALFTRMSRGPVSEIICVTCSRSQTSATTGLAVPPSSSISRQTFSARSRWMSLIQRSAPARAIWIAIARPTPPPDPVTSAVRPAMKFDQSRITSDLHDDRDDRGPAAGAVADELPQRPAGVGADRPEAGGAVGRGLGQRLPDRVLRVLEQLLGLGRVHPTL